MCYTTMSILNLFFWFPDSITFKFFEIFFIMHEYSLYNLLVGNFYLEKWNKLKKYVNAVQKKKKHMWMLLAICHYVHHNTTSSSSCSLYISSISLSTCQLNNIITKTKDYIYSFQTKNQRIPDYKSNKRYMSSWTCLMIHHKKRSFFKFQNQTC